MRKKIGVGALLRHSTLLLCATSPSLACLHRSLNVPADIILKHPTHSLTVTTGIDGRHRGHAFEEHALANIRFISLNQADAKSFMALLNLPKVRTHLIEHPIFDHEAFNAWIEEKTRLNNEPGCKIRAVKIDGQLAGWAGIQRATPCHEAAIVLAPQFWAMVNQYFTHYCSGLTHWAIPPFAFIC